MAAEFEKTNQYIWNRYIDNAKVYGEVDEDDAVRKFEEYYSKHSLNEDDDCFYYGVLLYEKSFAAEKKTRIRFLRKAQEIFKLYREMSGETDWDVIEDRLEDVNSIFEEEGIKPTDDNEPDVEDVQIAEAEEGMVLVPAGKFLFGQGREEKLLESFLIDIHPVTNAEYGEFLEATTYRKPASWDDPRYNRADQPVVGVSWMDALKYCEWRGKALPTEEQWEKASRGTDGRTYPWGEDLAANNTNFATNGADGELVAVGSHDGSVSPFGLRESVGYVWEWTSTPDTEEQDHRVVKGGSWADGPDDPEFLSSWARTRAPIKEKNELLGFRCCKPIIH